MRNEVIQRIMDKKIIAIVRGVYGDDCVRLAEALYDGGIELLEITFDQKKTEDNDKTLDAIRRVSEHMKGKMDIGAGTVTSAAMLQAAADCGARFIISPNVDGNIIKETHRLDLVSIPGALTPTEILYAHDCGADFVKVFPTVTVGDKYIKQVRGPLNHIRLMAVGGVDECNIVDYLNAGCCGAGIGGCLVNKEWIKRGEFDKITELARVFVYNVKEGSRNV